MSSVSFGTVAATATIPPPGIMNPIYDLDTFAKLLLLIIVVSVFIRACYLYITMNREQDQDQNPNTSTQHDDTTNGLPFRIINSYHTFLYSKTNVATIHKDHVTSCCICISDYKESEMLRMMPQCFHYFHRDCVDPWLKVNGSCPICRNSLLKSSNGVIITMT